MRIVLGTGVQAASRVNGELQVTLKTGEVLRPDMALFATGRLVNTQGLGLDAAGVKLSPRGVVEVDNHFQTSIDGVYAAGDVIGPSLCRLCLLFHHLTVAVVT
jgi:pyruvate/2-oxoglutarate dehydrogenase complex dihydrolipoamide dehydrogenase (E3) component